MEVVKESGGSLDERLRNMIMSNVSEDQRADAAGDVTLPATSHEPLVGGNAAPNAAATTPAHKATKKRPNQAQRRQMSAQLNIPIEPRTEPAQSARLHVAPRAHRDQQRPSAGQFRNHSTQSAPLRPHGSRGRQNHPWTTAPLPAHARHQQSPPHSGPMGQPGPHSDWRQPHPHHAGPYSGTAHATINSWDPDGRPAFPNPGRQHHVKPEDQEAQAALLEELCRTVIADAEIEPESIAEKESFRSRIEQVCRAAISLHEREQNGQCDFPPESVTLRCFGSLSSGFATKASDMDLGLLSPLSQLQPDAPGSPIPRIVEKAFLDLGLGARLLSRARIPIIKVCEEPPEKLRRDLVEERSRWEEGAAEDADVDDEVHGGPGPNLAEGGRPLGRQRQSHGIPGLDAGRLTGDVYEQKLATLRQTEKQSLTQYYGAAKGLLRKLGGRDLTHSNMAEFSERDYQLVNNVSLAFVRGLFDEPLKRRLEGYQSLSPRTLKSHVHLRSLLGVYTQVEGEDLVSMWYRRPTLERNQQNEQQASHWIQAWLELQGSDSFIVDPMGYNKELQLALDRLKKIPSIHVLLLQQGQYESPTAYHARASRILNDLGGHDRQGAADSVRSIVIQQYVSGVYMNDIRTQVEQMAQLEGITLRAVARRHKSLQLAHDFGQAVEKGMYDEPTTADVESYMAMLRGPARVTPTATGHPDLAIPLAADSQLLVAKIRQLTDPSRLTPNQPRDPYRDRLEFPKSGVGVQCDINFSPHLALHNTLLLRCYSNTDPRVRPLVLFVKHWAKVRAINSPYRGTLCSYGYVLMVLHYLVNIAQPFVCPNLQQLPGPPPAHLTPEQAGEAAVCRGRNVQFWSDEAEIQRLARANMLTRNSDSVGYLLRGFFEYYAQSNTMSTVFCRGFDWGRDVLSLRTHGGLLTKQSKGWTGAKTVVQVDTLAAPPASGPPQPPAVREDATRTPESSLQPLPPQPPPPQPAQPSSKSAEGQGQTTREVKEVRHRYLFAIEDPFELDHNVARTVTHHGIVAIRDEFRRAWRIIKSAGNDGFRENLLQDAKAAGHQKDSAQFFELLDEIHGLSSAT